MMPEIRNTPMIDGGIPDRDPEETVEYGGMQFPFSQGEIVFGTHGAIDRDAHFDPVVVVPQTSSKPVEVQPKGRVPLYKLNPDERLRILRERLDSVRKSAADESRVPY